MASTLAPGTLLHGKTYRITRFLSRGGFGCTYEAEHILLGRHVALKELFVGELSRRDEPTGHVEPLDREKKALIDRIRTKFLEEARVLCNLRHPGIVNVSDLFEENGTAYYAMEFIVGQSLQEIVDRRGALPEREAAGYIRQVAEALRYVHSRHRLHLDIKPANVMVDGGGNAILIDFGVSKQYDEVNGLNTSTLMGVTPNYAPPEQVANGVGKFLPATDIYALGATLYTLLTGKIPASCVNRAFGQALDPLPAAVSEAARRAVDQAMRLDLATRTADADAFLNSLGAPRPAAPKPAPAQAVPGAAEATIPKPARDPFEGIIYDDRTADTHWDSSENPTATAPARKAYDLVWPPIYGLTKVRKNDRYGFIDEWGKEIVPIIYEAAWNFREGLARVRKNGGKYGFIDKTGKEVVPIEYDDAHDFRNGFALVEKNACWGYVDKSGRVVVPIIYDFPDLMGLGQFSPNGIAIVKKNGKYGAVDTSGRLVIPLEYDGFGSLYLDGDNFHNGLACALKNGKWGFVDAKGNIRIPPKYLEAYGFRGNGIAPVCKKNPLALNRPKWGFIDTVDNIRIAFRYDGALPFNEGLAPVAYKGKWGVLDTQGKIVVPCKYDYIDCFSGARARVYNELNGNRKWGLIDKNGKELVRPLYQDMNQFFDGLARVCMSNAYGYIDMSGKEVIPCIYSSAFNFSGGYAYVEKDSQEFFIDKSGKEVSFS